ncbi:MAG: DUF4340 domain-containing protein [Akkermansiaceae bacterium]
MKSKTVILLWIVAIALGITTYFVQFRKNSQQAMSTQLTQGDKLIENLPIRDITRVVISRGDQSTEIIQLAGNTDTPQWGVAERDNYPVDHELLRNLLGVLAEIKVTQGYPCEEAHYGRFGLKKKSDKETERALCISMILEDGSTAAELYMGKYSGGTPANARFVRLANDDSGVYAVGETFPGVAAQAQTWLDKDFLTVDSIQSISLSAPHDPEFITWTVMQVPLANGSANPNGQLVLQDISENELMQLTSTNQLKNLFRYSNFIDVLNQQTADETSDPDKKLERVAEIKTADGISYLVRFWPQTPTPEDQTHYLLQVDVSAGASDDVAVMDKLARVKKLEGHIYQVSASTISPLQKVRSDFVKAKPQASSP